MENQNLFAQFTTWFTGSGYKILIIVVGAFLIVRVAEMVTIRLLTSIKKHKRRRDEEEFLKRVDTLRYVIRYVFNISILLIAVAMILKEIGVDIRPILAAAGVLGIAVGFGAQSLVKDIISGFFILLENQIRVGDVVQVAGKGGVVEEVNLKMTILRDLSGNVHYIPNGEITVVTNMTKVYSRYVFNIGVAYREDVDQVIEVIQAVDENLRNDEDFGSDILEPIEILGLDEFADSALIIKARTKTKPIKQWRVAREFNRRLKKAFDEKGIEIPFPHTTLYMGKDKDNTSPPLNVTIEKE